MSEQGKTKLVLHFRIVGSDAILKVRGQEARSLAALVAAGPRGITALEVSTWALRLAHYAMKLRRLGLAIEMVKEPHEGPGGKHWHGRYILKSPVEVVEVSDSRDAEAA